MDIRSLRQRHKIRFRDLADLLGISQNELSKFERGLAFPSDTLLSKLADIFRVDWTQLRDGQQELRTRVTPGEGYTTAKSSQHRVIVPTAKVNSNTLKVMDLFCGTGGFSHGFEQTRSFEVTLGLDLLADRAETFTANHPAAAMVIGDIRRINFDHLGKMTERPDIIIGGPPCQGFSSIRPFRTLTEQDPRNNLFESFVLAVSYFKPRWFVLENVVGLLTHEKGRTLKTIVQLFEQSGYTVSWRVLNAALYGLPQRRERLIVVGNRHSALFRWPEPTHYFDGRSMAGNAHGQTVTNLPLFGLELQKAVTVMDAIHDLPELAAGESSSEYRFDVQLTPYETMMRREEIPLSLHEATRHSSKMLEIIRHAGFNRSALPEGMTTSGFSSSYSRLEPDSPSVTLTVNFVHPASNKCIHPCQDRALTPREGARLQGFADDYIFKGNRAQVVKQIGNAVPPLLGKVIAEALLEQT